MNLYSACILERIKAGGPGSGCRGPNCGRKGGLIYYRGTEPGRTERIQTGDKSWDSHLFVTEDPAKAKWYGSQIEKITLKPEVRILREGTREFSKVAGKWKAGESLLDYSSRAAQAAQKAGYHGVHFLRQGDVGTAIFDREMIDKRENLA